MTTLLEGAYTGVEIAKKWEAEGDLVRAHKGYGVTLTDFMFLSLMESVDERDVSHWLANHPFEFAATRYVEISDTLLAEGPAHWINSFRSNHYDLFALAHFFALLGHHDRAGFLVRNAREDGRSTPFWQEYCRVMKGMEHHTPIEPRFKALEGLENHWRLMST
jgi:hypothetical protein